MPSRSEWPIVYAFLMGNNGCVLLVVLTNDIMKGQSRSRPLALLNECIFENNHLSFVKNILTFRVVWLD